MSVLKAAHHLGILNNVTKLNLDGVEIEAPLVLSSILPNLTSFLLQCSTVDWGKATAGNFPEGFSKLQAFWVWDIKSVGDAGAWQEQLQQQLSQLSTLQSLSLCHCDMFDQTLLNAMLNGPMPSVAGQLTSLWTHGGTDMPWSSTGPALQLVALKVLRLDINATDEHMPLLLALPALEQLEVLNFQLVESWPGCSCKWRELGASSFHTDDLPLLPLHSSLLLKGQPSFKPTVILRLGTPESIEAAAHAIASSQMPAWQSVGLCNGLPPANWVYGAAHTAQLDQLFLRALPLFVKAKEVTLYLGGLSIGSILAYLDAAQAHVTSLHVQGECVGSVTDIAKLISLMPAGSELRLECLQADEDELVELCSAAKHDARLHIGIKELSDGLEGRVQAALQRKGHPDVKLESYEGEDFFVEVWRRK